MRKEIAVFSHHYAFNVVDGMVERSVVLQLQCAHSSGKASCLGVAHALGTTPQIASRVGVAAARGVDDFLGLVGWNVVELAFGEYDAALAAQCDAYLLDAPFCQLQSCLAWVGESGYHLHLVLVHLYYICMGEYTELVCPVDGIYFVSAHLTQIALMRPLVDRYSTTSGEKSSLSSEPR